MFRRDINGLRGWAVISVIFYHFGFSGFSGGFIGVDVFFVISGFLMTGIVVTHLEMQASTGKKYFFLLEFYLSRARRIIPALTGLCAFTLAIGWHLLTPLEYKMLADHVISALGFFSNFTFLSEAGYFDSSSHEKLLLHTWSLSVEWQFYLFFPLMLLAVWSVCAGRVPLIISILLCLVSSLFLSVLMTYTNPSAAFYLLPMRAWEMLAGALAYLMMGKKIFPTERQCVLECAGFALLVFSVAVFDMSSHWPGWQASLPVLATVLILMGNRQNSFWTGNLVFQELGKYSYSLYLWHWPFVVLLAYLNKQYEPAAVILALVCTLACGVLSYHIIEKPFGRRLGARRGRRAALWGGMIFLSVSATAVWVHRHHGVPSRVPVSVLAISKESKNRNPRGKECFVTSDSISSPSCTYGGDQLGVIVIGDSHAASVMRSVEAALPSKALHVLDWTLNDCQIIAGIKDASNSNYQCGRFVADKIAAAATLDHSVPLLIIDRLTSVFYGPNENDRAGEVSRPRRYLVKPYESRSPEYLREMRNGVISTACEFAKIRPVYMLRPIPELKVNVPKLMARTMIRTGALQRVSISLDEYRQRHDYSWVTQNMAAKECGIRILDPLPLLCSDGRCWGDVAGLPIYFDDDHLNERGARLLIPLFQSVFSRPYDQVVSPRPKP